MEGRPLPADEGPPGAAGVPVPLARGGRAPGRLLIFLFADIRGFTAFTGRYGAAAAAALADAFVTLGRETAESHGGALRGTWGDQVLIEFTSPRDALGAAVDLLGRCREATLADPDHPLPAGAGLDVGEPAEEGNHRSAPALNVAARLCARAAAGEVLATRELVHLAGAVDGLAYVDRGAARLKGVAAPTRVVRVCPVVVDRDAERRFHALVTEHRRLRRDPRAWVAALVCLALVAVLGGWAVGRLGEDQPVAVPAGGVAIVDGDSATLVDAAPAGGSPDGVADSAGALWVAQSATDSVLRIDRESKAAQTVVVGRAPVAVTVTRNDVWVVNSGDRSVSRVSAVTNREIDRVRGVGNQPVAIAAGFGSLWVANQADATVSRIDLRTGRLDARRIPVGRHPSGIAVGAGAVWVTNSADDTVTRIDHRTRGTETTRVGAGPVGISVAASGVWVANRNGLSVSHLDPTGRRGAAEIPVGDSPAGVATRGDAVWVGVGADGAVVRIDAATDRVADTVRLGASPYGLALVGSQLWAATRPFVSAQHFGGTMRIATRYVPGTLDPALLYDYSFQTVLYGGLFGFRRVGGVGNLDLAPNLAVAETRPTDGGRTYSFRLRPGIRYSDGRTVVPADFRRGLERAFSAPRGAKVQGEQGGAGYYLNIVGAQRCSTARTGPCDLSAGIVTDRSTVTFHLVRPDPELPFKLAQPFASPVPPGTPAGRAARGFVPGVGAYAVGAYVPGRSLRLVRNRFFTATSAAVRPRAYPAAITWREMGPDRLADAVESGDADLVDLQTVPRQAADALALRQPAQTHRNQRLTTLFLYLDTSRPPFDRLAARRAVSLAVDRRRIAVGVRQTRDDVACGLPPPGFPAYERYCTSFAGTASPTWQGTDLTRARRLVASSGTRGARVEVHWWSLWPAALGRDLARTLRRVGYDARLHLGSGPVSGAERPLAHVSNIGWLPDFPAPSNFYEPLLSCSVVSTGRFCDRDLDALAARAVEVDETDPGAAERLWRRVYRTLSERAVVVPLVHFDDAIWVSARVGNYTHGAYLGPLYDQMWVR